MNDYGSVIKNYVKLHCGKKLSNDDDLERLEEIHNLIRSFWIKALDYKESIDVICNLGSYFRYSKKYIKIIKSFGYPLSDTDKEDCSELIRTRSLSDLPFKFLEDIKLKIPMNVYSLLSIMNKRICTLRNSYAIRHIGIAYKMAESYKSNYVRAMHRCGYDFDDLFSIAFFKGILRAIDVFDPKYNCTFSTYAYYRIKIELKRVLNTCSFIRDPIFVNVARGKLFKCLSEYKTLYGDDFDYLQLSKKFNITIDQLRDLVEGYELRKVFSLDSQSINGDPESPPLIENIESDKPFYDPTFENKETVSTLLSKFSGTTKHKRQLDVIKKYYGLLGTDRKNLGEIGSEYGITKEGVRQIRDKALEFLKVKAIEHSISKNCI